MPALARKETPESYQNYRTPSDARAKTAPGGRWHESPPPTGRAARQPDTRSTPSRARDAQSDRSDLNDLLEHFTGENAARSEQKQKEVEAHRVERKRARLRHRPFRLTIVAGVIAGAPLTILACLLWMNSSALALSRQDTSLNNQIKTARSETEQTQREIAAVNASPQVQQWAKERGWRSAQQNDFDSVTKPHSQDAPTIPTPARVENNDAP